MACREHKKRVDSICLNTDCSKNALLCNECQELQHVRHPFVGISTIKQAIRRLINFKQQNKELAAEHRGIFEKMKADLLKSQQSIQKQCQQLAKLSEFFVSFKDQLLNQQDIGEAESTYQLLGVVEERSDHIPIDYANQTLLRFFIHLKASVSKGNDSQVELSFQKTTISQIRTKYQLEKQSEQSLVLKERIDDQTREFDKFFDRIGAFFEKNPQYVIQEEEEDYRDKYEEFEKCHKQVKLEEGFLALEPFCQMAVNSLVSKEATAAETFQSMVGSKKQILRLCHYLIFYSSLQCEEVQEEQMQKNGGVDDTGSQIKCVFCQLLKLKSFLQGYFRQEVSRTYSRLCKYTQQSQEIWVHEQCMLWTNMVIIDHKFNTVEVKSILPAVKNAVTQMCRFCDQTGASLKCNNIRCDIYYHFYCLKKSKIRGLQLDVNEKYRFFCEDHHARRNFMGHSEWFLSCHRLRADVKRNGLQEEPKRRRNKVKIEINDDEPRKPAGNKRRKQVAN